jgi:hypothetical protein
VQGAGKRLSASRWQRKRRRGNNVLATSASYFPSMSQLPSTLHWDSLVAHTRSLLPSQL